MGRFVRGDVVVVPFPFTDLTRAKRRPALVLSDFDGDDVLLSQITSRAPKDRYAIPLARREFSSGGFVQHCHIRPNKLFTAHRGIVLYRIGSLTVHKMQDVLRAIIKLLE